MATTLTYTDLQIIEELRKDAQQSSKRMADAIGCSEETVRRRVIAMTRSGALQFHVGVSAEALGMPIQALINVEASPHKNDNLLEKCHHVHVKQIFLGLDGNQVYEIAAKTLRDAGVAVIHLRTDPKVTTATITFLYPNGDHRI